ncbi:MAG: methylglyoxal reductase [Planctomycetota bacterium]|jgi:methylglyoxal reductase
MREKVRDCSVRNQAWLAFSAWLAGDALRSGMGQGQVQLGQSDLFVSPVAFGTWPIAGVTSLDVNDTDSLATLRICAELGINFIDTAHVYGRNGESEKLISEALGDRRDDFVIATKCGKYFDDSGQVRSDARPETIRRECEESLQRLGTDRVELYYLHEPDPVVPLEDSAGAIADLITEGKVRCAGLSNSTLHQIEAFHAACPLTAVQLPYNMLQRDIERLTVPWCRKNQVSVAVYWPLMKGLLAGKLRTESDLALEDMRRTYPMYQGEEWDRNQKFVAHLREIASECNQSVPAVVINWTIRQPGITAALCGAKRAWQIEESAEALRFDLSVEQLARIAEAIAARGMAETSRFYS